MNFSDICQGIYRFLRFLSVSSGVGVVGVFCSWNTNRVQRGRKTTVSLLSLLTYLLPYFLPSFFSFLGFGRAMRGKIHPCLSLKKKTVD